MKNRLEIVILAVVLVVLIAVGGFAYRYLSDNFELSMPQPQPEPGVSATESVESKPPEAQKEEPKPEASEEIKKTEQTEENKEPETVAAPDFMVYDADGNEVKLSDKKGKPVVVDFWASWCGPCKAGLPKMEEAYKKYGDRVEFMMVNLTDGHQETAEKANKLIEENGYTFPVYYDKDLVAAYVYQVNSIPRTLFVDADGNAVVMYTGLMPEEVITERIEELLK